MAEEKKKYRVTSPVVLHRPKDEHAGESYRAEPGEIVELDDKLAEQLASSVEPHEEEHES